MLSRDEVMAAATPKLDTVHVPEWGGEVAVRKLGAGHFTEFQAAEGARRYVLLIRFGVVNADCVPMFTAEDDDWLLSQPWDVVVRVANAVGTYSGILKPLEEAEGN